MGKGRRARRELLGKCDRVWCLSGRGLRGDEFPQCRESLFIVFVNGWVLDISRFKLWSREGKMKAVVVKRRDCHQRCHKRRPQGSRV